MNVTERTIFEQFDLWGRASHPTEAADRAKTYAVVGCGTSYNLALSIAAILNGKGCDAVAVPGNEWVQRPGNYRAQRAGTEVIAISRSGESTELVQAAEASRRAGLRVVAITCDERSSLVRHADFVIAAATHPEKVS
jgi:glucosamine--fructose-6-phosphate aminotransferase (isomerizing)